MNTPIADFVKKYRDSDISRFHMPGHKGKSVLGCEELDITEISGADVLCEASGIIGESEENASTFFSSAHSFYSTEGSSLAIKAMLALIKKKTQGKCTILAARNAHKAFMYAAALLDLDIEWLYPEKFTHLCSCVITPGELENRISAMGTLPSAVYITSPDYLGNISDIKGLSSVCQAYGIPLLVDNAHGAYLAFLTPSLHPLHLGADMCCDSAHKTLPVLTGGAYLHISKNFDCFSPAEIRNVMAMFGSTSPSYLILQSLDLCNTYLEHHKERLAAFVLRIEELRRTLGELGFATEDTEPLKLVFSRAVCGYSGTELAEHLREFECEPEFADENYIVLMLTPEQKAIDFERLTCAFSAIKPKAIDIEASKSDLRAPKVCISARAAMLCASECVNVCDSLGRICASPAISCPPGVPIIVSGEQINEQSISLLEKYGIKTIDVIKMD